MSGYVNDYSELVKVEEQKFEELLEADSMNFFERVSAQNYSKYLARYYYNKSLSSVYENKIIIVPKNGYITQRLVYINPNLTGGTKVGTQAINITEQDGTIQLSNSGAVSFCPLSQFFDSLCYAFGIQVDYSKIDVYSLCDSVLQNFEFIFNRETGGHITVDSVNFNNIHVLYIIEDEKTYFDEDLVQAFANKMYEAGWFDFEYELITDLSNIPLNTTIDYGTLNMGFSKEMLTYAITQAYKNGVPTMEVDLREHINDIYSLILENMPTELFDENYPWCVIVTPNTTMLQTNVSVVVAYNTSNKVKFTNKYTDKSGNVALLGEVKNSIAVDTEYPNKKAQLGIILKKADSSADEKIFISSTGTSNKTAYAGSCNTVDPSGYNNGFFVVSNIGSILELHYKVDGITVIDGAKVPTALDSLSTDYPSWFSRLKNIVGTTVETVGETLRNAFKVIEFVPLTLIGGNLKPTQDEIHTGTVLMPTLVPTMPEYTVKYLTPLPDTNEPIPPDEPYVPPASPTPAPVNPPTIGGITPPTPEPPIMTSGNGLFTVYNPTQEQLNNFGGYLWGEDIVGILQSIFQNPMQAIISLHVIYATPETGDEIPIKVGYMTSSVNAKKVTNQYIQIDCGTVDVPEYYGSALDYSPFTKAHIYLPFIGMRELNVNEIMGTQVNVKYSVDVLTGTVYASISVFHNAISQVLYTFEGNCAVQLPLTGGDVSRLLSGMITGIALGATRGGIAGAVIGGASGAMAGGLSVSKSGSIGANAGAMGIKKPYIIITHNQPYMANNYNTQHGYPANITIQLSSCKGYTRVKDIHVENISTATQEEKDMIQNLLKQGVIIE